MKVRLILAAVLVTWIPNPVDAQVFVRRDTPRRGSLEISAGATGTGGQSLPAGSAALTNPSVGQSSFTLFTVEPAIGAVVGARGGVAVYVTRALAIEGGVQFSRPQLKVRVGNDAEAAADVTSSTTITSYVFTGSVLYHFGGSRRTVPFLLLGGGHLRDVHNANELLETGTEFHGMAGVKVRFGARRKLGLRAEAGVSLRDGGFSYDDDRRVAPMVAISLLYLY